MDPESVTGSSQCDHNRAPIGMREPEPARQNAFDEDLELVADCMLFEVVFQNAMPRMAYRVAYN
ncbi:MAG TPA: hypothetical protein VJT71_12730 [Pyrinomonadaceae bacterium]|nr:hypothetical protein [Pyrinomonadaceae bacterium]